ncbi:hypothetical protein RUM43_014231 [Polyplax serrata]|uniref:Peptidase M13 N-terminal domain-containing protein n=1 Tax=Polyplax serrata TaxID=468196 RepID=A0AAN8NX02_POLSC
MPKKSDQSSQKKVCLTEECVRTGCVNPKSQVQSPILMYIIPASSLLAAMDLTANPCQDFFQYACGTWNKKHIIPEDRSSISTFEIMADQLQVILKGVLEEPFGENETIISATRKAKLFYKSCMNLQQIGKIGDAPLRQVLKSLGGWPVATRDWKPPSFSVETLLGKLRGDYNEGVLIEQWVGPDDKNSSAHILQLDQMQLALPSRDYYLKMGNNVELKAYHRYMTQIAILLGADDKTAEAELEEVIKFEVQLANATLPEADRHDTSAIYRKLPLGALQKEIPQLNWKEYLSTFLEIHIKETEPLVTYAMPYFVKMGEILMKTERRQGR